MASDAVAVAAVLATLVGSLGVLGQIWVTHRQLALQEASTYRDQAQAWRTLADEWTTLVIAGLGPVGARQVGMNSQRCLAYQRVVKEYRDARLQWHDALVRYEQAENEDHAPVAAAEERLASARAGLDPFLSSIRAVLVHLAQLSDLVLRRRLNLRSVYDAVGHDIVRDAWALKTVARLPYDGGDCPGPQHHEIEGWRNLTLDDVSARIGWASALSEASGATARVHLLLALMILHGEAAGDAIWEGPETLAEQVIEPGNLARLWRPAYRVSPAGAWRMAWSASGIDTSPPDERLAVQLAKRAVWRLSRPVRCIGIVLRAATSKSDERHLYLEPLSLNEGAQA